MGGSASSVSFLRTRKNFSWGLKRLPTQLHENSLFYCMATTNNKIILTGGRGLFNLPLRVKGRQQAWLEDKMIMNGCNDLDYFLMINISRNVI